jgi:hypothetical protein
MGSMSQPHSLDRAHTASSDMPANSTHSVGLMEPTFLGLDYVCTQLPTHVTPARTKEQQALLDQAYDGWERGV